MPIDWDKHVIGPLNDVFGEPVTYRPVGGGSYSINGVFDAEYHETTVVNGDTLPISTEMPVLGLRLADLPVMPGEGDEVDILSRSETYLVRTPKPDGHGHAKLMLVFKAAMP